MNKILALIIILFQFSCNDKKNSILKLISDLPLELKEISGIAFSNKLIYTIEDSGNKNEVVVIDSSGTIKRIIALNNVNNIDWEDLTFDNKGNLYIGDFGNNYNVRRDLAIYKINKSDLLKEKADVAYKISFDYIEQTDFPPNKKDLKFDVEAFFEHNNYFYLFTKNRSRGFDGTSFIYKIPNTPGHHHAKIIKIINTCTDYNNCAITSAAISPDASTFVLLSQSKIWLFKNYSKGNLFDGTMIAFDLNHFSQKEAVCYKNKNVIFIADENKKKRGGNLYEVNLDSLK